MNIKFETIRSNKYRILFFGGVVCVVILLVAIVLNATRAKYRTAQSMPLYNATVNYSLTDLNIVAIYVGGEAVDSLDSSKQYTLDTTQSTCTYKDGSTIEGLNISYETETGSLSISPFTTKGTKCTLYFDEYVGPITIQDILAGKTISTRSSFSSTLTTNTTGTIYQAQDDDGTTYYFAGNPTDNWVSFAGFFWRIIRINGDGSIRLIYSGDGSTQTTGDGTQVGTSTFSISSSTYNNNAYVGYMYTLNEVHGTEEDSGIKGVLDNWYLTNIQEAGYSGYIDTNAGFCGDRTSTTTDGGAPNDTGGTGTTETYYGARYRLYTNKTPTFECSDKDSDLYTVGGSNKGNKALTYPVGLITADEVAYAGGVYGRSNSSYYLYTNSYYWTMSPFTFDDIGARVFFVYSTGDLNRNSVGGSFGVRPAINLRADTHFNGTGTSDDPYTVVYN